MEEDPLIGGDDETCGGDSVDNKRSLGGDDEPCVSSSSMESKRSINVVILIVAMVCSGAFASAQIVVGVSIGSMALLADSVHMFADVVTYIINLYAECSNDTEDRVKRKSLYAASFSLLVMVGVSIMISIVSLDALLSEDTNNEEEDDLDPRYIVLLGSLGLLFDGITVAAFLVYPALHHSHSHSHGGHDHDGDDSILSLPNMSSAFVHAAGDLLRSVTLIVGGSIAWAGYEEDTHEIDAICSLIIVALLLSASVVVAFQIYDGYKELKKNKVKL